MVFREYKVSLRNVAARLFFIYAKLLFKNKIFFDILYVQTQLTRGKHEKYQSIVAKDSASCLVCNRDDLFDCNMVRTLLDFQRHTDFPEVAS
jgi:hypothetical protein